MKSSTTSVPSEHAEQASLVAWYGRTYGNELLLAIPNGGWRSKATAAKLKLEGVRRGVPDLMLPIARGHYHGLFIELKRTKGGTVSAHQKHWLAYLNEQGYLAVVCKGAAEAQLVIENYLAAATTI